MLDLKDLGTANQFFNSKFSKNKFWLGLIAFYGIIEVGYCN